MSQKMWRQGDVMVRQVDSIPSNTAPIARDHGRIVLAYGEVTGHAHAIVDEAVEFVRTADTNQRFLRIMSASGAALRHEEHATITLPPGTYEVIQQREYTSHDMAPVPVMD
jgi:hypothetical protein